MKCVQTLMACRVSLCMDPARIITQQKAEQFYLKAKKLKGSPQTKKNQAWALGGAHIAETASHDE